MGVVDSSRPRRARIVSRRVIVRPQLVNCVTYRDDKVKQYLPTFKLDTTVRQLGTHNSGIGNDFPPANMTNWPHGFEGSGSPPDNGLPFPTEQATINAINALPLVVPSYSVPIYSDTAYGILGLVSAAADRGVNGQYAALAKRDIFGPLGMTSSSFTTIPALRNNTVVASVESNEAVRPAAHCLLLCLTGVV